PRPLDVSAGLPCRPASVPPVMPVDGRTMVNTDDSPRSIQGGMGVAISGWPLARVVSQAGQLGVVSGTALELVCARRLQLGDPGGHVRRAAAPFPVAVVVGASL